MNTNRTWSSLLTTFTRRSAVIGAAALFAGANMASAEVPILLYGPIVQQSEVTDWRVTRANFEAHMQALDNANYNTITLAEYHDHLENGTNLPPNPIILTFTNGYRHLADYVDGVLNQHGFTGAAFLVTDVIGDTNANRQDSSWDEGDGIPAIDHLIWSEVQTLANSGWEIGSHTRSHIDFRETTTAAERQNEIVGSKSDIEAELGVGSVRFFSYPYGAGTNDNAVRSLVENNYDLALGVQGSDGPTDANDPYAQPRLYVLNSHGGNIFHEDLLGGETQPGDGEFHPADTNQDWRVDDLELSAYAFQFLQGEHTNDLALSRGAFIFLQTGSGAYTYDESASGAAVWVPDN